MCAAKALEQFLCKRFNDSDFLDVFIHNYLYNGLTQILRSGGFDSYMPDVFLSECNFRVEGYLSIQPF